MLIDLSDIEIYHTNETASVNPVSHAVCNGVDGYYKTFPEIETNAATPQTSSSVSQAAEDQHNDSNANVHEDVDDSKLENYADKSPESAFANLVEHPEKRPVVPKRFRLIQEYVASYIARHINDNLGSPIEMPSYFLAFEDAEPVGLFSETVKIDHIYNFSTSKNTIEKLIELGFGFYIALLYFLRDPDGSNNFGIDTNRLETATKIVCLDFGLADCYLADKKQCLLDKEKERVPYDHEMELDYFSVELNDIIAGPLRATPDNYTQFLPFHIFYDYETILSEIAHDKPETIKAFFHKIYSSLNEIAVLLCEDATQERMIEEVLASKVLIGNESEELIRAAFQQYFEYAETLQQNLVKINIILNDKNCFNTMVEKQCGLNERLTTLLFESLHDCLPTFLSEDERLAKMKFRSKSAPVSITVPNNNHNRTASPPLISPKTPGGGSWKPTLFMPQTQAAMNEARANIANMVNTSEDKHAYQNDRREATTLLSEDDASTIATENGTPPLTILHPQT